MVALKKKLWIYAPPPSLWLGIVEAAVSSRFIGWKWPAALRNSTRRAQD